MFFKRMMKYKIKISFMTYFKLVNEKIMILLLKMLDYYKIIKMLNLKVLMANPFENIEALIFQTFFAKKLIWAIYIELRRIL